MSKTYWVANQPKDRAGFMVQGPNIFLPPEKYEFEMKYRSANIKGSVVGRWDVISYGAKNKYFTGDIVGTEKQVGVLTAQVQIDQPAHHLQARTFF